MLIVLLYFGALYTVKIPTRLVAIIVLQPVNILPVEVFNKRVKQIHMSDEPT